MSENEAPQENQQAAGEGAQGAFSLQRVYVKDISFEAPNTPVVFQKPWKPEVQMDLNTKQNAVGEDVFEIIVSVTLTAKVEDMTAYIVEVQQAGICIIKGLEGAALAQAVNAFGPNLIFPYLRETIDSVLVKGGFPPAMLAPVNFDAIFAQAVMKKREEAAAATAAADESTAH